MPTIFVLLPAFNESAALSILIPRIEEQLKTGMDFKMVVVDDGSNDETVDVIEKLKQKFPVVLLRHHQNQGYGAALRTGFIWISEHAHSSDYAVSLDSDNTHSPEYIPALIQRLTEGFDVVTASYTMKGGGMSGVPWQRRQMSKIVNRLFHVVLHIKGTTNYTNGFRAYRVAAIQAAYRHFGSRISELNGFPGGAEFFLNVVSLGAKTSEVPFFLHYEERGSGSKIRILRTINGYLQLLKKSWNLQRSLKKTSSP